jgi:hypothetical protein
MQRLLFTIHYHMIHTLRSTNPLARVSGSPLNPPILGDFESHQGYIPRCLQSRCDHKKLVVHTSSACGGVLDFQLLFPPELGG